MKQKVVLSWSGGKDGCMALHKLIEEGHEVKCLITTVPKEMGRTFGHGEKMELVKAQSEALGIPLHFISCSFHTYTEDFITNVKDLKNRYSLDAIAYGDLYLQEHRDWGEKVAAETDLTPLYPLWMQKEDSLAALKAFTASGYEAVVIRVREDMLDDSWLGRKVDSSFVQDIEKQKEVCPMGEAGEYHTFVFNGPLFKKKIICQLGSIVPYETTKRLEIDSFSLEDQGI